RQPSTQQWQQQPQQDWGQTYESSYDQYGDAYGDSHGGEMQLAPILRRAGARVIDNALVAVFGFALVLPVTVAAFGLGDKSGSDQDEGGIWNWPIIFTL
ncbi:RDD family protein, partial [Micromonospora aurantiaca]|nr:RDD family protein [Micromonospora aurantiaca]